MTASIYQIRVNRAFVFQIGHKGIALLYFNFNPKLPEWVEIQTSKLFNVLVGMQTHINSLRTTINHSQNKYNSFMARQNFIGIVVSQGKMQKTVKVRVETKKFNKRINKELLHRKDYMVHDEGEVAREGDMVRIESTRPLSKHKFFAIAEIIKNKGQQFAHFEKIAIEKVQKEETIKNEIFLKQRDKLNKLLQEKSLLHDIKIIQDHFKDPSDQFLLTEINKIKEKYQINDNLTQDTIKQILNLDILKMEQNLNEEKELLLGLDDRITQILNDNDSCISFLKEKNVKNPENLKQNIKKNLIRKYLIKDMKNRTTQRDNIN